MSTFNLTAKQARALSARNALKAIEREIRLTAKQGDTSVRFATNSGRIARNATKTLVASGYRVTDWPSSGRTMLEIDWTASIGK